MAGSYLYLVSITQKVANFAFLASFLLGILLIILTMFGVRKIFGTYKYLMVVFSSLGIFLACAEVIIHPNLHFYNNGFVYFTLSTPFGWSKEFMTSVLPLYVEVYSFTISMLAVQFIYRYWALFNIGYMSYFRGWKSLVWVGYLFSFGAVWWISAHYFMHMDEAAAEYFKDEMLLRYNVLPKDIPMLTCLAFDPKDGSVRWDVMYTVEMTLIMGVQYSIMVYCGWNMNSKMEEKVAGLSVAMKRHHRQLFKALVLQITCPTLLLFSPLILLIYLPFFKLELSLPAGAAITAFSIYPAMDSIVVLIVVTEYKVAIQSWMEDSLSHFQNRKVFRTLENVSSKVIFYRNYSRVNSSTNYHGYVEVSALTSCFQQQTVIF